MRAIQATELAELLKDEADITLLDVREPWEHQLASIPVATLIPMGEVSNRLEELEPTRTTVVMCHHGNRSAMVGRFLEQHGFRDVVNLDGGIDGWSETVDPDVPRY
ncbi:MAG TPA: rhodanese-like domain-containing protein [Gammaproteobacteria bacterium]|jgi:rhodanese-related sulfurtransferase|nr:rhodanese-like domain-containing protein [Gammaproteobacteria bacterium]